MSDPVWSTGEFKVISGAEWGESEALESFVGAEWILGGDHKADSGFW